MNISNNAVKIFAIIALISIAVVFITEFDGDINILSDNFFSFSSSSSSIHNSVNTENTADLEIRSSESVDAPGVRCQARLNAGHPHAEDGFIYLYETRDVTGLSAIGAQTVGVVPNNSTLNVYQISHLTALVSHENGPRGWIDKSYLNFPLFGC